MLKQLGNGTVVKTVRPATQEEIESPNAGTYYYASLEYYKHTVYKCQGLVHSDAASREFYLEYMATHSGIDTKRTERADVKIMQGTYKQIPDRILEVNGEWIEHTL